MRKYFLYTTICLLCALGIIIHNKKAEDEVVDALSTAVVIEDQNVEEPDVVDLSSLQDIKLILVNANNISMYYGYWLDMDDVLTEVSSISTFYDYRTSKGHVVKLDNAEQSDIWFQDDNYYYTTSDERDWHYVVDAASLASCEQDASYFRKNLRTVELLVDVLSRQSDTSITELKDYTRYSVTITDDVVYQELLKSDSTADLVSAVFTLKVPKDTSDDYQAAIVLNYENSSLGISREKYTYQFSVNRDYSADIPVDIGG